MTEQQRFDAHLAELMPAYQAGRYADALTLIRAAEPQLPAYRSDTAEIAACLLCLLGRSDEAYDELRRAYDEGGWWARSLLENDDDLTSLRELPGFADLVDAADRRCQVEQSGPAVAPVLLMPTDREVRGTVVALHGAGDDGARAAERWRPVVSRGVAVVAPTSSQRLTPSRQSWTDPAVGLRDIGTAMSAEAVASAGLSGRPIVAAGLSAGGRQALYWALTGEPVAAQAFLLVCPSVRLSTLDALLPAAPALRGHVMVGADDGLLGEVDAVVSRLRVEGVETEFEVIDGIGHEYPADFDERAGAALDRLLQGC